MRKRNRKQHPPGTFLPMRQRVFAITQLCIAFSLILWFAFQPFMGEYFFLKSRLNLYDYVMGKGTVARDLNFKERQINRFELLNESQKKWINEDAHLLESVLKRPFTKKMEDGLLLLFFEIPSFELAWIVFSIIISIMLLKKKEGAKAAAWILPFITLCYAFSNYYTVTPPYKSPDLILFPQEHTLLQDYLKEPLSQSIEEQRSQLKRGWDQFLLSQWYTEKGREHPLEEAEFAFTIERLKHYHTSPKRVWKSSFREQVNHILVAAYLFWNILFAAMMNLPFSKELERPIPLIGMRRTFLKSYFIKKKAPTPAR